MTGLAALLAFAANAPAPAQVVGGIAINIPMPPVTDRGVFISQIGDDNVATVVQTAPNALATISQDGNFDRVDISQSGTGTGFIAAAQTGDSNVAQLGQSGAGENMLSAAQDGTGNRLSSNQNATGSIYNGAQLSQTGNYNVMSLAQDGSDNLALLTQDGASNEMTANQLGDGNRLIWTQQGNYLSDLNVTQTGGDQTQGQLMIMQTNPGN
jgi:hypothetical protein